MNTYKLYQVDAFAEKLFTGNPAAVCPLDSWISDDLLQKIAMENNLAETAFYVGRGDRYEIRWFTPKTCAATPRWRRPTSCSNTKIGEKPRSVSTRPGAGNCR